MRKSHIALLGDSILDNASYVKLDQAVSDHLNRALAEGHGYSLLAVDGDTTQDVLSQMQGLPEATTHFVLSVGGNDALGCLPTLDRPANSVMEALGLLNQLQSDFIRLYEKLMADIEKLKKPTLVCTIYDAVPNLPPALQTALSLFNDVITRSALRYGFDILDLRELLDEHSDFSVVSPIEPSEQGGRKLAGAIGIWATRS